MAYIYESIQNGIVNLTIPGKNKTVTLFKGTKVTIDQKLTGGYLRVLRLVGETPDEKKDVEQETHGVVNSTAKVEDKITKVEEVVESVNEEIVVEVTDEVKVVEEQPQPETSETPINKKTTRKRN